MAYQNIILDNSTFPNEDVNIGRINNVAYGIN